MNPSYGSLEILFTRSDVQTQAETISIITNIGGIAPWTEIDDQEVAKNITIEIAGRYDAPLYKYLVRTKINNVVIDESDFPRSSLEPIANDVYRVFFFNRRVSVYVNDLWIYSYSFYKISYPIEITASLKIENIDHAHFANINRTELCDGRQAIYVDYESNSDNAIQSIIQQRPIEVLSAVDRKIEFTYDATKADISALFTTSYADSFQDNSQTSSDGLVYSMDVGISIDPYVAEELGLITRLYRLPDLESGIERAASAIQRRARQSMQRISTSGRFDPRIEVSDIQVFDNTVITGTQRIVNDRIIVEDVSITIADGQYRQTITGRREVDAV